MNERHHDTTGRRFPWLAALLSFIMPGVGQVYCGMLARGLVFGILYGLAIPATLGLLAYIGPAPSILFGLLALAAAFGVVVAAVKDGYGLAVKTRLDYELKGYNRPAVYLLVGLMIQGSSIGFSLYIRTGLFEAFRVPAVSMFPTIAVNDRILGDKTVYRNRDPQYGEIILFHPPTQRWRDTYIKRIVALGGDTVAIKGGDLYLNGQRVPRHLVASDVTTVDPTGKAIKGRIYTEHNRDADYEIFLAEGAVASEADMDEIAVPKHHCFVLGDNRNGSLDSRQFGCVAYAQIEGRADYLYWPTHGWSRFGRLD